MHTRALLPLISALCAILIADSAQADPLFGWGENALEDRFLDGDLDEEDHAAMRLGHHTGTTDVHGQSWFSLVGFTKELLSGEREVGGILVLGLALDRISDGPVHRLVDPPKPLPTPSPPSPPAPEASKASIVLAPALARECVAAALRASGLGVDDARIDALVSRARTSAWLPETRMRGMRLWTDAAHTTTLATTDTANFYDALGANLVLELRLTWRFDRLLYAGDEPTLERVRLERQDARSKLATRTLEALFAWQRALVAAADAKASSREAVEAELHAVEAQATLDVLTGGWFSLREPTPPPSAKADPP